jgi:lysozyme
VITRRATDIARDFIARWEGLELKAYQCSAGVWTIGYGSTKGVQPGDTITAEAAATLLEADMTDAMECVDRHVDVDLDDGQVAALISFVFNVGCDAFKGSTMLKLLNAGQIDSAAGQFKRWNKADGKVVTGLTRRRHAEEKLFRGEL